MEVWLIFVVPLTSMVLLCLFWVWASHRIDVEAEEDRLDAAVLKDVGVPHSKCSCSACYSWRHEGGLRVLLAVNP